MPSRKASGMGTAFEKFASRLTKATGRPCAFGTALAVVLVWGLTGPVFGFSDTWQLVINTGTTIVTFLMVFLIQHTQNKDTRAMELKLNELVAAVHGASNRLIDVEGLSEKDLDVLHKHYQELARIAAKDSSLTESHSVEEAERRQGRKKKGAG